MADRLSFQLDLTGDMANALRGVVNELNRTNDAMGKVVVDAGYLDEAMAKAAAATRHASLSLADHMKIARGFSDFAQAANEASLTVEQHAEIAQALGGFFQNLSKLPAATEHTKRFRFEWGNMYHSFAGFRKEADGWVFNLADGMRAFGDAARRAVDYAARLAVEMGRAVANEQDLSLAEKYNLGAGGAAGVRSLGDSFGNTRHDDGTVRRALLPLMRAGIRDQGLLDDIATAAADIEALTAGETRMSEATAALGKIAVKRDFGERQLEALGINAQDAFANLGNLLGKSAEAAKKLAGDGKVSGETLLSVVLDELAKKQGGSIGTASLEAGKTLGASFQRLSDLPENLMKLANGTPAMVAFQKGLDDFVKLMQGPTGAKVMEELAHALTKFVGAAGAVVEFLSHAEGNSDFNERVRRRRREEGGIAGALSYIPFIEGLLPVPDSMSAEFKHLGVAAGDGVSQGMSESLAGVGADAGQQVVADFAGPQGIDAHSPSRKFAELGRYAAQGFELGVGDIAGPDMTFEAMSGGRGSVAAAGHTFNLHVYGGSTEEVVDKVTARIEQILAGHYERAIAESN